MIAVFRQHRELALPGAQYRHLPRAGTPADARADLRRAVLRAKKRGGRRTRWAECIFLLLHDDINNGTSRLLPLRE